MRQERPRVFITMDSKRNFASKKKAKQPLPRVVGQARTEFGTRLCQRISCIKCQSVDYVPVRVSADKDQFCRACAEKVLFAYDQGRKIEEKKLHRVCKQCTNSFLVSESVALKKEILLCIDCARGFDVWRGKMTGPTKEKTIFKKAGSKSIFRKKLHDTI